MTSVEDAAHRGSRGGEVLGVCLTFVVVAFSIVTARLITRFRIVRNVGLDDGCIVLALVFSIASTTAIGAQVKYGLGRHQDTLSLDDIHDIMKYFWVSILFYNLSITFTKTSILVLYLRIFPQKWFRVACWILLVAVVTYSTWMVFSSIFFCWPVAYFWDRFIPTSNCLDKYAVWFVNAGINILSDFALVLLPMPAVKHLNLPKRQRIALMLVFALAGFVCIISILRLHSLYDASRSSDLTWDNAHSATWSCVEINVGISCASLPTLKACISRFFPRVFHTATHSAPGGIVHGASFPHQRRPSNHETWTHLPSGNDHKHMSRFTIGGSATKGFQDRKGGYVHSQISSQNGRCIHLENLGDGAHTPPLSDHGINVVTVVKQEVHESEGARDRKSESGSEKALFPTEGRGV